VRKKLQQLIPRLNNKNTITSKNFPAEVASVPHLVAVYSNDCAMNFAASYL
jgi:hypothetical protein